VSRPSDRTRDGGASTTGQSPVGGARLPQPQATRVGCPGELAPCRGARHRAGDNLSKRRRPDRLREHCDGIHYRHSGARGAAPSVSEHADIADRGSSRVSTGGTSGRATWSRTAHLHHVGGGSSARCMPVARCLNRPWRWSGVPRDRQGTGMLLAAFGRNRRRAINRYKACVRTGLRSGPLRIAQRLETMTEREFLTGFRMGQRHERIL
jgi:hypothetical protein